jgi:hypothetical protein
VDLLYGLFFGLKSKSRVSGWQTDSKQTAPTGGHPKFMHRTAALHKYRRMLV